MSNRRDEMQDEDTIERLQAERDAARRDRDALRRILGALATGSIDELGEVPDEVRAPVDALVCVQRDLDEALEAEKRARAERDHLRRRFCSGACDRCNGSGRRGYADTATWRGGMGGATITEDVCDRCWGSGDKDRPGADLRRMTGRIRQLEHALERKEIHGGN